jgi:hypothetical protein
MKMPLSINESNLNKAYRSVLACTGIGAATKDSAELLDEIVLVTVPVEMQDDYSPKLLACAVKICCGEPYRWTFREKKPRIEAETTFRSLYDEWFLDNVFG